MGLKRIISGVVVCLLVPLFCISGQDQCPDGYGFSFQNSCYKFVSDIDNRNNAERKCTLEEAYLIDIKSAEEQKFIVSWLNNKTEKDVWIGLVRQGKDDYVWTDDSPLVYSAWAPDQPTAQQCIRLQKDNNYQWTDRNCNTDYPYICEIEALHVGCPSGWHFYNDFCYFVNGQQPNTYDEVRGACIGINAALSSVNNQEEQYIHNRFVVYANKDLWIGLNDIVTENDWQWEDKSTYNFTNWENRQPDNNKGNEHCTHLWKDRNGKWNDAKCDKKLGYICKKAIPKPTKTAPTTTAPTTAGTPGTPKPQSSGLSSGAIAGVVIGSVLLLVLLMLILFVIASRPRYKTQTKSGKTTALVFDGPYDLTIEGKSNYKPDNTEQFIYTDADDDKKQQPIHADSKSTKPATDVYQSIVESSTDDNSAPVYIDVVTNNDAPNSKTVPATRDQESGQETSLYYAISDSHQDTSGAPNTSQQESCQDGSLYYAKSDLHPATNGDLPQESNAANTGTGWEDNAAYSSFEDGERVQNQDDVGDRQEQEGWEDNSIYVGSDPE